MHWLETLDVEAFRFLNLKLVNPIFDVLMPFVSGNAFFYPILAILGVAFIWKGRARGIVFVAMMVLALGTADGFICRNIKHAVGRSRPFAVLSGVHQPTGVAPPMAASAAPSATVGRAGNVPSGSMPSSHAANWFAATLVALIYYRRSLWFMLPGAILVSYSRIYNGVHYPSDVLAGAVLGAGSAAAVVWSAHALWHWAGQKWFPLWWARLPSLMDPRPREESEEEEPTFPPPRSSGIVPSALRSPHVTLDEHWLRLGYVCIALLLLVRLGYIASGTIQLSEDESYQWLWSKHLALSYYSKPPLIAYTQFLSTAIWGDTAFGVRFFSPFLAAALSLLLLRFFAREVNARAGLFLLLIITATPLVAVGAVLLTIDPLSVFFWTLAMLAGWRAVQEKAVVRDWLWVGLWMGLGFLSKYTELFQWLCWAVFFALYPPARKHLRHPGPYVALLVNLLCAVPVLLWNSQRDWITVTHVANDARAGEPWHPTIRFFAEFLGGEAALLNPIFFGATVWAAIAFWRRGRQNPRLVYFFSMGAPLFLAYLLFTFHSRVLLNWIAPSVLPLFCFMVIYWDTRWRLGAGNLKPWLTAGLALGFAAVILGHNTDLVGKMIGRPLPVNMDILHRVREWKEVARMAGEVREELLSEGKPVFIIADHYGLVGEISFYLPEAKTNVTGTPLVYFKRTPRPLNQFYFWPGYDQRKGENAIYIRELDRYKPEPTEPPPQLVAQFESVTNLCVRNVMYHGRLLLRPLQFFACRGLKE